MRFLMKLLTIVLTILAFAGLLAAAPDSQPEIKTFKTDADGFIQNWLVLEPIALNDIEHTEAGVKDIISRDSFKDEISILPTDAGNSTIDGASYQWHAVQAKDYLINLVGFASAYNKPIVNVVFWGVAYVTVPEEMKDARLAIGSDDDSVWWVNGKQVIGAYGMRQTSMDDNVSKRLTLNKGVNVVRFAVVQGDGPSDCCARFYDARQKPITNLTISLNPPDTSATSH
jgi:hypothetical protein